ncbi:hypothetical protein DTL21_28900 [Bremerella cremea]|uniref:Uncharacterized protein n=1 Tax=Blastopirellula marina TaxID=124 RepID=A0A2S8F8Z5_9BACT|nr:MULTISPECIES: hypothetical protein [Pirellulaceae]PQO28612.1 hypothetical protein C5Y83_28850 [Blastopirellula marina]RCS41983.1 hypothetical protein DTL21_28900 [Bremerella cremea]
MPLISYADYQTACNEMVQRVLAETATHDRPLSEIENFLSGHDSAYCQIGVLDSVNGNQALNPSFRQWTMDVYGESCCRGWSRAMERIAGCLGVSPVSFFRDCFHEFVGSWKVSAREFLVDGIRYSGPQENILQSANGYFAHGTLTIVAGKLCGSHGVLDGEKRTEAKETIERASHKWITETLRFRMRVDSGCHLANYDRSIARRIQKLIGGKIYRIMPNPKCQLLGRIDGCDRHLYYHDVVLAAGKIFDDVTAPMGRIANDYKSLWEHANDIDFGF